MYEHLMLPLGAFEPKPGGGMRLYGGKGSSAPPPDPRLIEAQIRSMGIQDDVIKRIMQQSEEIQLCGEPAHGQQPVRDADV